MPEYWGRDSPYHPGTDFLGTPANHLDASAAPASQAACCSSAQTVLQSLHGLLVRLWESEPCSAGCMRLQVWLTHPRHATPLWTAAGVQAPCEPARV